MAVRVLINGSPIAAFVSPRWTIGRRAARRRLLKIARTASRATAGTWRSKPSTGPLLIECGAIRERVSQELARKIFDAVKKDLEKRC